MEDKIIELDKKAQIVIGDYIFEMEITDSIEKTDKLGHYLRHNIKVSILKGKELMKDFEFQFSDSIYNLIVHGDRFTLESFRTVLGWIFSNSYDYFLLEDIDDYYRQLGLVNDSVKQTIEAWATMQRNHDILKLFFPSEEFDDIFQELIKR